MKRNILIAYYSRSSNTRKIAELIQEEAGGTLFEIQPVAAYPAAYNAVIEQAKKEIQTGYRPALKSRLDSVEAYDTVFVGSPNWWSTIAPPIGTFLSGLDFSGKILAPFCTHGEGGRARVLTDMARLCPDSTVLAGLDIYGDGGDGAKASVSAWLREIKMLR